MIQQRGHAWGVANRIYKLKNECNMLDFEVKSKVQPVGERKGQTVYYAQVKSQQKLTNKMLVERIVCETLLSWQKIWLDVTN